MNKIVINHEQNTCIAKESGYNLLNLPLRQGPLGERIPLQVIHHELQHLVAKQKKLVMKQLISEGRSVKEELDKACLKPKLSNVIAAICECIKVLADQVNLEQNCMRNIRTYLTHYLTMTTCQMKYTVELFSRMLPKQ